MTGFLKDLRYAGRSLRKDPGLTVIAVTALALGIGLTTVMFSIVYSALVRGLPSEGGERVMSVRHVNAETGDDQLQVPVHDYAAWRADQSSFQDLAAYYNGTMNVRGTERAERFDGGWVTANLFRTLGVQPVLGRGFQDEDDRPGAPLTVVLGWAAWQDRYDGDPGVLGRSLVVNGEPGEIIGVMPEGFRFPSLQELWLPLRADPLAEAWGEGRTYAVVGKLRPGVTADEAAVELNGLARRIAQDHPETNAELGVNVRPFTEESIGEQAAAMLLTMLGAVGLVLLIACFNVANLLLARASVRTREMAVRTAMGAHRWRVMSQMVAEALALALAGALGGTLLAWGGVALFSRAVAATDPPYWLVFKVDGPILLFVLALTVLASVISGTFPAWKATSGSVTAVLKDESRGSSGLRIGRLSRLLVVGELALSVGLLVSAGLMVKSVTTLRSYDYGFRDDGVFTARLGLPAGEYEDPGERLRFFQEVRRRVDAVPGVEEAAVANALPGTGSGGTRVALEGVRYEEERDRPVAWVAAISPGFLSTLEVAPLLGRDFGEADDADGVPVAIVNESFVRSHFPDGSPLERRIRAGGSDSEEPWRTIVGVVPDLYMQGVQNPGTPQAGFYIPMAQDDNRFMSLLVRGPAQVMSLTTAIRDAVATVDPDIPLYWVDTLEARIAQAAWFYRVFGGLFMVFGLAALFLAAVGLYGVMSFTVSRRTAEVGIRMALGAGRDQVLRLILRQGMAQIGMGLVLGLGLAVLLSRGVRILLFEVSPNDPVVFASIIAVLGLTGLVASLVPARRATRVDPMVALRSE